MQLARLMAWVPDALLGALFLVTWRWPSVLGGGARHYAEVAMVLEFLVIHSAVLMGRIAFSDAPRRRKTIGVVIAAVVYSSGLAIFGFAYGEWWAFLAFWLLVANRLGSMLLNAQPALTIRKAIEASWARAIALYMLWMTAALFLPLPMLGTERDRMLIGITGYYGSQALVDVRQAFRHAFPRPKGRRPGVA